MKFKGFSWLLMSLFFFLFVSFYAPGDVFADAYTITDEKFGGDCSQIGTWDAVTKTCTLSTDITSSKRDPSTIIIGANDITLNGNKHTISGYDALGSRGIIVTGRSGVTISNITVRDFNYGVVIDSSNHCTISRVTAISNVIGTKLDSSTICTISNSTASQNGTGIAVLLSDSSTLFGNTSSQNKIGIKLIDSQSITCTGNSIESNSDDGSSFSGTGVLMENSVYNTFQGNTFLDNDTHGCWLHNGSNFNTFSGNTFANNAVGLNLRDTASNNTVYGNNFLTNTSLQAYDGGTANVFHTAADGGNQWSDYNSQSEGCIDRYIDGYCDAPYAFTNNEDGQPVSVRDFAYEISASGGGDCNLIGSWEESTLTCTLTNPVNISGDGIVIKGDNIIFDGNGSPITGNNTTASIGVFVSGLNGVTLRNLDVSQFDMGVVLFSSNSCQLTGSNIANNVKGVATFSSSNNIFANSVLSQNSEAGIEFFHECDSNTISRNRLQANGYGVLFNPNASNNTVFGNEFVGHTFYPAADTGSGNIFYTLADGGNHWDGYDIADEGCYDIDFDDFCDSPYIIDPPLGVDVEDHMAIAPRSYAYTITSDGGDCDLIGSWDASGLTCTLINSIDVPGDGILIEGDNITLDGNSQTITGAHAGVSAGIVVKGSDSVTVRDITVLDFDTGLAFVNANNGLLENSSISLNRVGILFYSTASSIITSSIVSKNSGMGLLLSNGAASNTVYDNTIQANGYGVALDNGSSDNIFYGNSFLGNNFYPAVDSGTGNAFYTAIDGGNYWDNHDTPEEGCDDIDFNGLCDSPYIISPPLGIDIEDHMPVALRGSYLYTITSDGGDCTQIGAWEQSTLTCTLNDEVVFNENGIHIADDNIVLDGNGHSITGSDIQGSVGIFVSDVDGVVIQNATLTQFDAGIAFSSANNCLVENSTIEYNQKGVNASASTGNQFIDSVISQNSFAGIYLFYGADSNTISGNTFQANRTGIGFDGSNNTVYKNYFDGNLIYPVLDIGSDNVFYSPTEGGNHWGTYDTPDEGCSDTDYDGYCDAPFTFDVDIMFLSFTIEDPMPVAPSDYSYIITSGDGGDCSHIGTWEPSSLTCTLNRDITTVSDGIYIADNNIILNGNNRSITGPATSGTAGVVVFDVNGAVVQNIAVSQFDTGITFSSANSCQLYNSNISGNTYGVAV
ncbi:MAG: NosD domain-containing protein, partial [Desulfobacterales bacterium]|nr:NosD domain-containing protein [Desulfobacterales bacterium]